MDSAVRKGDAGYDRFVQCSHAAILFFHLFHHKIDCRGIAIRDATSESKRKDLFR